MKEAFDLIKEMLKERTESVKEYYAKHPQARLSVINAYKEAISIVSEVEAEYGNYVCEWKNEKGMFIQNPHTGRKFSNEPSMKNIYCNTCGKKIKVVE